MQRVRGNPGALGGMLRVQGPVRGIVLFDVQLVDPPNDLPLQRLWGLPGGVRGRLRPLPDLRPLLSERARVHGPAGLGRAERQVPGVFGDVV